MSDNKVKTSNTVDIYTKLNYIIIVGTCRTAKTSTAGSLILNNQLW